MNRPTIIALIIINPSWFDGMKKLPDCLDSVNWCDKIIICTSHNDKNLNYLAKGENIEVVLQEGNNFAEWRTNAIKSCKSDWVLLIDSDEVVGEKLKNEILQSINNSSISGYAIPRNNYVIGKKFVYGGWYPDYVLRLIKVNEFVKYHGDLHEQPILKGKVEHLHNAFEHYKHDNLEDMVVKTNIWSETEGDLLFKSNHPPMYWWRFIKPFINESGDRLIKKKGIKDGTEGLIDGIYQGYSKVISYIKLWEKQQTQNEKGNCL